MTSTHAILSAIGLALTAGTTLALTQPEPPHRPDRRAKAVERFDADGDGSLSQAEREAARDAMRDRFRERMTDRFDADGDGALSDDERLAARTFARARMDEHRERVLRMLQSRSLAAFPPHVAEALAQFDINEDAMIDDDERVLLEVELDARLEARKAEAIAEFDADGDGELSPEERRDAGDARRAQHEATRAQMREKYDADGDGVLDREEMQALRAAEGAPERDALLELFRPRRGPAARQRAPFGERRPGARPGGEGERPARRGQRERFMDI